MKLVAFISITVAAIVVALTGIVIFATGQAFLPVQRVGQPTTWGVGAYAMGTAWLAGSVAIVAAAGAATYKQHAPTFRAVRNGAVFIIALMFVAAVLIQVLRTYANVAI